MKKLLVKKIDTQDTGKLEFNSETFQNEVPFHSISEINWKDFDYSPEVRFKIAHSKNVIYLQFDVKENYLLAKETRTNGEVYKDSCVEFFISFDNLNYYNFEFNCIGTTHLAFGPNRHERKFVSPEIVGKIQIHSSLGTQPFEEKTGDFNWKLLVAIPVACFAFDDMTSFSAKTAKANFYKCADNCSRPHYLSWNPIKTLQPDFHQSKFFGQVEFVS